MTNGKAWRRLAVLACGASGLLAAHDIITTNLTFTRDISRVFAQRCLSCHAEGSSIPLATYEQARPWAVDIKEQVLSRAMPPWGAVKGFGNLSPDHALSQEEIMIISAWVIGGAPEGDPALAPRLAVPSPEPPLLPAKDTLTVTNRLVLQAPLHLAGIRPLTDKVVLSAKITVSLPDGRVKPLLWLYRYDPQKGGAFRFREQIDLPARAVIEASAPLRFALQTATDSLPAQ